MRAAAAVIAGAVVLASGAAPAEARERPWSAAERVDRALFSAQASLVLGEAGRVRSHVEAAGRSYRRGLRRPLRRTAPGAERIASRELENAALAAAAGDERALAAARGTLRAALYEGSYEVSLASAGRGAATAARGWLLIRDFRTATRFTRPGASATLVIHRLARGRSSPQTARRAVAKDLLDAYQARMRELLDDAARARRRGFAVRWAETASQAAGYWRILDARYRAERGPRATSRAAALVASMRTAAVASHGARFDSARSALARELAGFTAAPLTPAESARRAQQLVRFLALVHVEYGRGVKDGRVTLDFEVQEAVAFRSGAETAFTDLEDRLTRRDRVGAKSVRRDLERLGALLRAASERPTQVADADEIEAITDRAERRLDALFPAGWKESSDESDIDLVRLTLDRMEAAIGAGRYGQAEQARLEAYAFFEFGPERRLRAFDQGLALDIEGMFWFGSSGSKGLAELIADRAPRREAVATRRDLDEALDAARGTLGDGASQETVVANAAIIVFREGLEAVLILAALTASLVGARARERRPVLVGAGLGLVASLATWGLARTLVRSLEHYGEKLEAIVGLVAIAVLLLITNWFFHRVYWTSWIARFRRRRTKLTDDGKWAFLSAQAIGLALLGLTSVYREGFETVLFLQSLQLSAGTPAVVEGAGLGLAVTLAVAVAMFGLQRKLPYKRMLIVTGVLIGVVLVVMVGQTARTMQGIGWLSITPLELDMPYWLGIWFGVFPTWETVGAQVAAAGFVIGSYLLAQELRVKRPRRRAAATVR